MAALRARLLEFLVERTGEGALTSYVRAQVIQTIVVIAKRAWLEDQVPLPPARPQPPRSLVTKIEIKRSLVFL